MRGSFQSLADALARCVEQNGGEVLLSRTATAIELADGRVAGVELDGAEHARAQRGGGVQRRRAPDVRAATAGGGPAGALPPAPGEDATVGLGVRAVLGARLDPAAHGLSHEHFVYPEATTTPTSTASCRERSGGTWFSVPTMHDPALAPEGEHVVVFSSLMAYDVGESWEQAKQRYTELMLQAAERTLPGYREALTFADSATPETFQRYTLAEQGAAYGWENTPDQTVPKRLDYRTPIEGLYLAGHWTHPGTGSIRCLLSGAQTAAAIEGRENPVELLGSLHGGA